MTNPAKPDVPEFRLQVAAAYAQGRADGLREAATEVDRWGDQELAKTIRERIPPASVPEVK